MESSGRECWFVEGRSMPCAVVVEHCCEILKVCNRQEHSFADPTRRA